MKVADFDFELPDELIARYPAQERSGSRLLCLDGPTGDLRHQQFSDLEQLLNPGDLLVMNNTRVIPARLYGEKATGGKVEALIERVLDQHEALAHLRSSRSPKAGAMLDFSGETVEVLGRAGALFHLKFHSVQPVFKVLERIGHMPLPPYMEREDEQADKLRYQTVYAEKDGAVAAPTAGLHFDEAMLQRLADKGIHQAKVTLHVGAGTFQPVKVDSLEEHEMHSEWLEVSPQVVEAVNAAKARGNKVIAVGTTSVRALESAAQSGEIQPMQGDTDIFLFPGRRFNVVDAMITNFHLPKSTLIMLISAFAGRKQVLAAYAAAIEARYRFYSYGDAMFITRKPNVKEDD